MSYQRFVFEWRRSVLAICVLVALLNMGLYQLSQPLEPYADDPALYFQTMGLLLLVTLMPMWILSCFIVTQRHTLRLAQQLDKTMASAGQSLASQVIQLPARQVALGVTGGMVFALALNIPPQHYAQLWRGDISILHLFFGQMFVWSCVGFLLTIRLHIAALFGRAGKAIKLSIFEQGALQPFARVGLLDVAIIVGALAITTVQSLDAQFRLVNYLNAFMVAVPAAVALLIRPMWAMHQRLGQRKAELLDEVCREIAQAPEASDRDSIAALEQLLQRRDRVRALNTWPLDLAIWSRLLFYGLIPPLTWMGAALVEIGVDNFLAP